MASGFGTFNSTTRVSSAGAVVSATLWQEVDTANRTVTVKLRVTAAYYRQASGSWTPGSGGLIYTSQNNSNYLGGYVGDATNSSTGGTIGLSSVSGVTYNQGLIYNIQEGYVTARSGCYAEAPIISKTYSYNTSGDAITDSWSAELYLPTTSSTRSRLSGTFTTDSIGSTATPPSGAGVRFNSATWNTINITSTVSDWGSGYTDTPHLQQIVCLPDSTASNWYQRGRRVHDNRTAAKTSTGTVTNSDQAYNGGLTIKGASDYKVACWASTTVGETYTLSSVVRTPPAPLDTFAKESETRGATAVATVFRIVGGSSTNNSANNVVTQYRLSTNGGSTYGNWTNVGAASTAYTAKEFTLNIPYSSNVSIQVRQYYGSDTNATAAVTLTYTALGPVAPSNPAVTVNSKTWNSASLTGTIDDYGYPSAASGRKLNIGLADGNTGSPAGMEVQTANATSATVTVNNSSAAVRGGFTLKGMMTVYPYTYADNTAANNMVYGSAATLSPAPGQLSYSVDPNDIHLYTISYSGDVTKNVTTYTQADLTRTVRYADSTDPTNWTYIANGVSAPVGDVTTQQVSLTAGHTYTVEAWMDYAGEQSEISTVAFTVAPPDGKLYCSIGDQTEQIEHFYGSVNGQTKKITKLYASVNGVAKLIFED